MKKTIKDKVVKIGAIGGFTLIAISLLGMWWANAINSYRLVDQFVYIFCASLIGILPIALRWAIKLVKFIWALFKRMVYEVFYVATKAIVDGKKNKSAENE